MMQDYAITTVVTPATSFDLTTLDNVKADLGITGNSEDAYLRRAITQASVAAANYCNRVFALQTYQDSIRPARDARPYFLPNGQQPMYVRRTPLLSVNSVTENGIALVAGDDYEVDLQNGFVYRLDSETGNPKEWPSFQIVIEYDAGYVAPGNPNATLPADVEDAIIRMVKARRSSRTRDPFLKTDSVQGVGSQEFWVSAGTDGAITPDIADLLDNYRIQPIA